MTQTLKPFVPDFLLKSYGHPKLRKQFGEHRVSPPVPLSEGDLHNDYGWVYDREYGFFLVNDFGCHEHIIATIESWKHGYPTCWVACYDSMRKGERLTTAKLVEDFMNREGTCYMSSQSCNVQVGKKDNLSVDEIQIFRENGLMFTEIGD